jgi:predicted nucleic acid-binding protein
MADTAVVNTSPIITLARSGWIDLLRAKANRVVVPATVAAEMLAIPYRGTLSVVAEAKSAGTITSARSVIADLRRDGLYISDRLVAEVLARVGE